MFLKCKSLMKIIHITLWKSVKESHKVTGWMASLDI